MDFLFAHTVNSKYKQKNTLKPTQNNKTLSYKIASLYGMLFDEKVLPGHYLLFSFNF